MARPLVFVCTLLALSACDGGAGDRRQSALNPSARSAPARIAALTPAGAPQTLGPETDAMVQTAASVARLDRLEGQNAKLFGTAGGDPAMNGLYTYVAFYGDAGQGWRVFRIGDFLDYRLLRAAPGVVDLEVEESVMDTETTRIGSQKRRLILAWKPGADGAAPTAVTVQPAA